MQSFTDQIDRLKHDLAVANARLAAIQAVSQGFSLAGIPIEHQSPALMYVLEVLAINDQFAEALAQSLAKLAADPRHRMPTTRTSVTHKFSVMGHEGYLTAGMREDGSLGEIFIRMSANGSTVRGLMDAVASLTSTALQYGVPLEVLVKKFESCRFEPRGHTGNEAIPTAESLVDYIFRWLAVRFIPDYVSPAPTSGIILAPVERKSLHDTPPSE